MCQRSSGLSRVIRVSGESLRDRISFILLSQPLDARPCRRRRTQIGAETIHCDQAVLCNQKRGVQLHAENFVVFVPTPDLYALRANERKRFTIKGIGPRRRLPGPPDRGSSGGHNF